jgi:hypothetical protein
MDLSNLKPGLQYEFHTTDFHPPIGDVIPGEMKLRTFVGMKDVGAKGMPTVPFVEVERADGTRHLIAVETIRAVNPA